MSETKRTYFPLFIFLALTLGCAERRLPGNNSSSDGGGHKDGQVANDDLGGGCRDNSHCKKSDYCKIDTGCKVTGAKLGACEPRPTGCNLLYDPVCGCDGKTYGNTCAAAVAGINVAAKGPCSTTNCTDLANEYHMALAQARGCSAGDGPKGPQCTLKVQSALACGCPTFVNPQNKPAVAQMSSLEKSWNAKKCDTGTRCPPMPCRDPKGASCNSTSPGSAQGQCADTY